MTTSCVTCSDCVSWAWVFTHTAVLPNNDSEIHCSLFYLPPHCLVWLSFPEPFLLCWPAKCCHCGGQWWGDGCRQVWWETSWLSLWTWRWCYRVRVSWGQVENFKCVDYFQIEYYEQSDPAGTAKLSGKINRHRKSHDIDIKPCSDYLFKVGWSMIV